MVIIGLNNSACDTQVSFSNFDMHSNCNSMPPIISYQKAPSAYSIASSLFPEMRSFTSEEQRNYTQAISKIYKPTGMKLF
ncbi:MAG: hypothetical protein IK015_00985 [Treponema sp.]|nr:hypothetical protein [Treponema sp.]